ncbi:MAG TPA: DUF6600 domain-containing protein [Stellaceae bacterium]|nr:DUF6600 domain-containing protein [Stellaceae bacterium]
MRRFIKILSIAALAWAAAAVPAPAGATPGKAAAAPTLAVPPARVGRVSGVTGSLSFHAAGETAWSPAGINYPVAAGEGFQTADGASAEIEIGRERISLSGDSEIDIAKLDGRSIDIKIARGKIAFRLVRLGAGESVTIELPRGNARLLAPGSYDITADAAPQSVAATAPHETASGPPLPADVAANTTGVEDLAAAGSWTTATGLGAVWYPKAVPAGWVPYRDGHWAWIEPWGWTWIDAEPWGFAPSHFGRWAEIGGRWGWFPGKRAAQPVYAPALVAFIGTAGVGISVAGGHGPAIGWFPLAPGEIYWPSYTSDLNYIRELNRPDVENAGTIRVGANGEPPVEVVNWRFLNRLAASVVPRPAFAAGRPVALALLQLPQERLREAPAIMGSPRVTPAMLRALAAPPPRPAVAERKGPVRSVRVAVAPQRHIEHASVAARLQRLAAKPRPAARPETRHASGARLRVLAFSRAEPKPLLIRAHIVRPMAKPVRRSIAPHPTKVIVKRAVLRIAEQKKPAP